VPAIYKRATTNKVSKFDKYRQQSLSLVKQKSEMPLQEKSSGRTLASAIELVSSADYRWIAGSKNFKFNWKQEAASEVYKIFYWTKKRRF
jgi:hypothetical protein